MNKISKWYNYKYKDLCYFMVYKIKKGLKLKNVLMVFAVIFTIAFIVLNVRHLLDDDMSSDMVLGNLLASEGKFILTKNWYYSTEMRILTIQAVFSLLFRFFSSWYKVRVLGTIIVYLIFIVSVWLYSKETDQREYFPYIVCCLFMPLSSDTLWFCHLALLYLVYLVYTFLVMYLMFRYCNTKKNIYLLISFIASIVFCLEGSRFLLTIYLPLLCAVVIKTLLDKKHELTEIKMQLISLSGAIIGCLINKFYIGANYLISYSPFHLGFNLNRTKEVVLGFLENNGYGINPIQSFISILLLLLTVLCIIYNINTYIKTQQNNNSVIVSMFYLFGFLGLVAVFVLTDIKYFNRYFIPISIFSIPIFFMTIKNLNMKPKNTVCLIVVFLYLICGIYNYKEFAKRDKSSEADYIANRLVDEGYYNGYSFFWSCGVITELSNGKIDMRCWGENYPQTVPYDFNNIDQIMRWQERADHTTTVPEGKVFIVLTYDDASNYKDLVYYFTNEDVLFYTKNCVVYGFESYYALKSIMHQS